MYTLKKIKNNEKEKVFLVGVDTGKKGNLTTIESMEELESLSKTVNAEIIGQYIARRTSINPGCFIGKGKAAEIGEICKKHEITTVIFDDNLSPSQQRNLEEIIEVKVIDRTNLILDIFASRARTREGILQVELAQLDYLLPRLTGRGVTFSQQVGGIGVRGPGEKKLEYDRRKIHDRIHLLKNGIEEIREHRQQQRRKRQENFLPVIALIGYTNAGKSTLLNNICNSDVFVEDKLFATLDPTTRRVSLPGDRKALFIDTVGLINKLPHQLIAAFRATLEEIVYSDILIHVVDVSHQQYEKDILSVEKVLEELNILDKPVIFTFNKVDLIKDELYLENLRKQRRKKSKVVLISATDKYGFDELFKAITRVLKKEVKTYNLEIPQSRNDIVSSIYKNCKILKTAYKDNNVILKAELNTALAGKLEPFIVKGRRKKKCQ